MIWKMFLWLEKNLTLPSCKTVFYEAYEITQMYPTIIMFRVITFQASCKPPTKEFIKTLFSINLYFMGWILKLAGLPDGFF